MTKVSRVVALGASNLTRGIRSIVDVARAAWGRDVQVLAAMGHGRSYGARSRVGFRALPGILESGLWRTLEELPPVPTKALVTDVGNDLLYGFSAEKILSWIDEALQRVQRITPDITLTGLPHESIRQISRFKYLVFRSILFPQSRASRDQLVESAEKLNAGLAALATRHSARFIALNPAWYGFDPIHIRRRFWTSAWSAMLSADSAALNDQRSYRMDRWRLRLLPPERRWIFGREQIARQSGYSLSCGVRVWRF
jgi:hypothetical protein